MINEVQVQAIAKEADAIVSVYLQRPDDGPLPEWRPGAHVDLLLPNGSVRQYSLSGAPSDRSRWRVTVKREAAGSGGSAFVHDELRAGDKLQASNPRNHFSLVDAERYIFIAGGIGITPLLSMVRTASESRKPWKLHYCGRSRSAMPFLNELHDYGESVQYLPSAEGRRIDLQSALADPAKGTVVYCCGPERLMSSVQDHFARWPRNNLHLERFKAQPRTREGDSEFDVLCTTSNVKVRVTASQSILEAVEAAGVSPAHTCREGTCGSCETQIIEGVADHRDSVLSAEEKSANESIMICVSRSRTAELILDL